MKSIHLSTGLKIAHRGLHDQNIPENSILSFQKAKEAGIPIELDVHLLRDGTIVVFHDDNLKRMTGVDKMIKDCTYPELNTYFLKESQEKIPTLEQVLGVVDKKVPIVIELKYDVKGGKLERALSKQLDRYHGPYLIKSFWPFTMLWWKRHRRQDCRGLLIALSGQSKIQVWLVEHLVSLLDLDFISYEKGYYERKFVQKWRKKGLPFFFWTIRTKEELEEAQKYGKAFLVESFDFEAKTFDK